MFGFNSSIHEAYLAVTRQSILRFSTSSYDRTYIGLPNQLLVPRQAEPVRFGGTKPWNWGFATKPPGNRFCYNCK